MSWRKTVTALAAGLFIIAPAVLRAQPGGVPPAPPPGMRMAMRPFGGDMLGDGPGLMLPLMLRHGDLSADQQKRVQEILAGDRDQLHALFRQLDAANDALAARIVAPGSVDATALQPDVDKVAHLRQELMEQGLKTALAVRAVLTPEQLAKAAAVQIKLRALQTEMRELLDGK